MNRRVLPGLVLLLAATTAAQTQFEELWRQHLLPDRERTEALALADFDGDGDLDLVVGNLLSPQFFSNEGDGIFVEAPGRLPGTPGFINGIATVDADGDGDLDLVVASRRGQNQLFVNDGAGQFTDMTASNMPVENEETTDVAVGDVDGDGDSDLVLSSRAIGAGGRDQLLLNDGSGTFLDGTALRLPAGIRNTSAVALGDVDGDGDLDCITATNRGQNRLWVNDGTGTFVDRTVERLPVDNDWTEDVAFEDVDGDGDLDLVLANQPLSDRLYLNNGNGEFADVTSTHIPPNNGSLSVVAFDADRDGDVDLLWGNGLFDVNRVFVNDGSGRFDDATATRLPPAPSAAIPATAAVAAGDVDGDGDADVVFGNGFELVENQLLFNDGLGFFVDARTPILPTVDSPTQAVAAGDVDGDGDLDLLFADGMDRRAEQNRLALNDGRRFADVTGIRMPAVTDNSRAVALGDVDGDGDLDAVFGNWTAQNRLLRNDGTGAFEDVTAARMPVDAERTEAVALADVDGDGDLDLVLGNGNQQNRLYLGDGAGTFVDGTAGRMPPDFDDTNAIVVGDVDGDGDPDLVTANGLQVAFGGRQNELYLNDGTGVFAEATAGRLPALLDTSEAVAMGDVDGDGDPDLVFGNYGPDRLYLNDGSGHFSDASSQLTGATWGSTDTLALGDVDGDGDLDLVAAGGLGGEHLYTNDGAGVFAEVTATRLRNPFGAARAALLADFDGDGDADLLVGNEDGRDALLVNLLRQLHAPLLAFPGRPYWFDVHARYAPGADTAMVFLSPNPAALAIPPFGTFGLDPALLLLLAVLPIPQPAGTARVAVTLPNIPMIIGAPIYAQGFVVATAAPSSSRLTQVTLDHVLR